MKVTVTNAPAYTRKKFQATLTEWDLDAPIGYGDTIQDALQDFINSWELKHNEQPNFTWS
jgi:hypothetical protein